MQLEEYLQRDDRIVLPLGSTEQHAYLSLGTDNILAERVAVEAAEPLGVPVLPVLPYGITPRFAAYPGSPTLRVETFLAVVTDLLDSLPGQGFRRILIVNGHGGNTPARMAASQWGAEHPETRVRYHDWWNSPRVHGRSCARSTPKARMRRGWRTSRGRGCPESSFPSEPKPPGDDVAHRSRPSSGASSATAPSAAPTSTPTRTCSASGRPASRKCASCSRAAGTSRARDRRTRARPSLRQSSRKSAKRPRPKSVLLGCGLSRQLRRATYGSARPSRSRDHRVQGHRDEEQREVRSE